MNGAIPRIRIEAPPALPRLDPDGDTLEFLIRILARQRDVPGAVVRELVAGLIDEGRRFAATPSGRRWRSVLASSEIASRGWMLWNMLELDGLIAPPPEDGDTPGAMLEDVLRTLHAARIEDLARLISEAGMQGSAVHA